MASMAMSNSSSPRSPAESETMAFQGSTVLILPAIKSKKSLMTLIWSGVETGGRRENSLRKLAVLRVSRRWREDRRRGDARSKVFRDRVGGPLAHLFEEAVKVERDVRVDVLALARCCGCWWW